jgi:hypothetical protein
MTREKQEIQEQLLPLCTPPSLTKRNGSVRNIRILQAPPEVDGCPHLYAAIPPFLIKYPANMKAIRIA